MAFAAMLCGCAANADDSNPLQTAGVNGLPAPTPTPGIYPGHVSDPFGGFLEWCEVEKGSMVASETEDPFPWDAAEKAELHVVEVYGVTLTDESLVGRVKYDAALMEIPDAVGMLHDAPSAIASERGMRIAFHEYSEESNTTWYFISVDAEDLCGYYTRAVEGWRPDTPE